MRSESRAGLIGWLVVAVTIGIASALTHVWFSLAGMVILSANLAYRLWKVQRADSHLAPPSEGEQR